MLFLTLLFGLTACSEPSSSAAPENPYENLVVPENINFGMSADEVSKIINREIGGDEKKLDSSFGDSSYDSEYSGGMDEVLLNNYCALCAIKYGFDNPNQEEFEDERTLRRITFEVRDTIPYKLRTKERHGDIKAECENIKNFLVEKFGEPIYETTILGDEKWYRWDVPDQKIGVELKLEEAKTDSLNHGYLTLEYFSTEGYRADWYNL